VLDLFGRVPHRGESVEARGVRVTVETTHRTRILQVLVRLPGSDPAGAVAGPGAAPPPSPPEPAPEARP
jgi:Mg2+/Co2+ transporter CorC